MNNKEYPYIIIGAGLAGASAVEGIREYDRQGAILLIGAENQLPYDRPPLSKKLWFGTKKVEDIFLHDQQFYDNSGATLLSGVRVLSVNARERSVTTADGRTCRYRKLLLATGGSPRILPIPGGSLDGITYYRTLDDYRRTRAEAQAGRSAVVIGGGFIGSELAAALAINKVSVTMIFPEPYLVNRVFPESLGRSIQEHYRSKGVSILAGERPVSIEKQGDRFLTRTDSGKTVLSDMAIVGIGIAPSLELAASAGLATGNGIVVNEYLQTSDADIFAAGDNAFFPYRTLGLDTRIEHWDHALNQGKQAGRNMAGARLAYDHLPYFFSDLFEFGYEAVGEVDSRLEIVADWIKENDTGVIYYLRGNRVRGVMLCNVWDKVETARDLIRRGAVVEKPELAGMIK